MTRPRTSYNDHVQYSQSLYRQAKELHDDGQYEKAVLEYRHALQTSERALGKYHKLTVKIYYRLGQACWLASSSTSTTRPSGGDDNQQYVGLALQSFKRCLRLAESKSSSCDDTVFEKDMKQFLTENPKKKYTASISHEYVICAITKMLELERYGDALCKEQNYYTAIQQYRCALELEEQVLFNNGEKTTSNKINGIISSERCLDRADLLCKIALICRLAGSASNNGTIRSTLDQKEKLQISLKCYTPALLVYQNVLGNDHPATRGAAANILAISKVQQQR